MELDEAFHLVERAFQTGRIANGYLICGDVDGNCCAFVDRALPLFFPENSPESFASLPDIMRLEPSGKSRTIRVEDIRDRILEPMAQTAYAGGWKVGIIRGADRFQPAAANAFLKALEEPTPRTIYFLLTDSPDTIMPTILSRVQRIDLPREKGYLSDELKAQLDEALGITGAVKVFDRVVIADRLIAVADALKEYVSDELDDDSLLAIYRKAFYQAILAHVRSWMVAGKVPLAASVANINRVEAAYRRTSRYMSEDAVLRELVDRLSFPL